MVKLQPICENVLIGHRVAGKGDWHTSLETQVQNPEHLPMWKERTDFTKFSSDLHMYVYCDICTFAYPHIMYVWYRHTDTFWNKKMFLWKLLSCVIYTYIYANKNWLVGWVQSKYIMYMWEKPINLYPLTKDWLITLAEMSSTPRVLCCGR